MKKRIKLIFLAAILLCLAAAVLIYTRPLTVEQRYPALNLSQCTLISGYFNENRVENIPFSIAPGDPHFDELLELFRTAAFRTQLQNILPRRTKTHRYQDGDFKWSVMFRFENVPLPGGDTGSGDMLHINNFYREIDLSFDGKQVDCSIENQEQWLKDVMSILTQYPEAVRG